MDNSISDLFSTNEIFDSFDLDSDFNHLRFIFEEVLCSVSFIDVENSVFCEEIPKLKELCDTVINKITELLQNNQNDFIDEIQILIKRYIMLVNFATDAVKFVNKRLKFHQVKSLPLPICEILISTFNHCKESDNLYGNHFASVSSLLTDLFKKANELQSSFLNLMNNFIIFELSEEHQNTLMIKVIETLSNIGEIITSLDIKSTAELWKGYLILTQTHIEYIKPSINIEKPLKYFCKQVGESLILFEKLSELKKIETSLKIISFHLKIIIKLCGLYDHLGNTYEDLFHLLIILNRYFTPYLHLQRFDAKIIDLMQVYVSVAADPLLGCIISNREFVQYFLKNINCELNNDDNRLAATLLIISVLKKNLFYGNEETQQIWINSDNFCDILCIIFNMLELLHVEFSMDLNISIPSYTGERNKNGSLYEYLLIHTVSFILICNEKYIKLIDKLLFESIMQTNIWRVLFSSDIWCILSRYGPEETCFQHLTVLINLFLMVESHRNKPEIYFLKDLINRLFQLMTNKYKNEIVKMYPPENFNNRLWIYINRNDENQSDSQLIYNNMNSFLKCVDPVNFNNMMKSLELISTIKKPNEKISAIMKSFWMINENNHLQHFWQFQYIWNVCKATKHLMKYINNKDLVKILECVAKLSESNKRIQFINCMILKSLATKSIASIPDQLEVFTIISRVFKIALKDRHPIIKQNALETFTFFAQHTIHENILSGVVDGDTDLQEQISHYLQKIKCPPTMSHFDYLKSQRCVKFRHECECGGSLEPALKKTKNTNQLNIEIVLARMRHDTDILNEYFRDKNIPQPQVGDLSYIIVELKKLLQK